MGLFGSTATTVGRTTSDRRLLRLASFLEGLPEERFDYGVWAGFQEDGNPRNLPDLGSCGTVACAGGWATTIPTFRRLGLRLALRSDMLGPEIVNVKTTERNFGALAELFGLSGDEARYLFLADSPWWDVDAPKSPDRNATPKEVAKHIRAFVDLRNEHFPVTA